MNYCLIKLHFTTAVHFGSSSGGQSLYRSEAIFHADTLYSALSQIALKDGGNAAVESLAQSVRKGELLFSDSFPWKGDTLYLPKPVLTAEKMISSGQPVDKKAKKLGWLPSSRIEEYVRCLKQGAAFDYSGINASFGQPTRQTRVQINIGKDSLPYQVGGWQFNDDCGLWLIFGWKAQEIYSYICRLLTLLELEGIGGKTTSGYGKFETQFLEPTEEYIRLLDDYEAPVQILLTASLPNDDELSDILPYAAYKPIRRSGFVQSVNYSPEPLKKKTQYFLNSGATLQKRYSGDLYQVGTGGTHAVYRYSKPLFLGVRP